MVSLRLLRSFCSTVFIAVLVVPVVSLRCFGGFAGFVSVVSAVPVFRSGGFVSVFRVLVHAHFLPRKI